MSDTPESDPDQRHAAVAACRCRRFVVVVMAGAAAPAPAAGPGPSTALAGRPSSSRGTNFHLAANALAATIRASRGTRTSAATSTSLDYVVGRLVGRRRLRGGARRRVPPVRSQPGQLHARGSSSSGLGASTRSPACSITCRAISAIGRSSTRSPGTSLGRAFCATFDLSGTTVDAARRLPAASSSTRTWTTRGTANFDVMVRRPVNPRLGVFAHGSGELFGVDRPSGPDRGTQHGGRFEGGVRINGRGGALELFAGVRAPHRRRSASITSPSTWGIAGFRLRQPVSWGIMPERTPR